MSYNFILIFNFYFHSNKSRYVQNFGILDKSIHLYIAFYNYVTETCGSFYNTFICFIARTNCFSFQSPIITLRNEKNTL